MSKYENYTSAAISTNALVFEFTSKGPKGDIKKIVQFTPMQRKNLYNLGFGNLKDDGSIDDITTNDNKDRDKILATVAATVSDFIKRNPHCSVFFTGSTKERTRLYRMALTVNYEELIEKFEIWGLNEDGNFNRFQKRQTYHGFLIKEKNP